MHVCIHIYIFFDLFIFLDYTRYLIWKDFFFSSSSPVLNAPARVPVSIRAFFSFHHYIYAIRPLLKTIACSEFYSTGRLEVHDRLSPGRASGMRNKSLGGLPTFDSLIIIARCYINNFFNIVQGLILSRINREQYFYVAA